MTIARHAVAEYLDSQFSAFAAEIGQALADDSALGYGPDIDNALRQLSTTEANLLSTAIDETKRIEYFALAEYYAARRLWRRMAAKADRRLGPASVQYQHVLSALKDIMDDAAESAAALGYVVAAEATWTLSRLTLDFIEPEAEEDVAA